MRFIGRVGRNKNHKFTINTVECFVLEICIRFGVGPESVNSIWFNGRDRNDISNDYSKLPHVVVDALSSIFID